MARPSNGYHLPAGAGRGARPGLSDLLREVGDPDLFAWTTLGVLVLSIAGGVVMFVKTEFTDDTIDRPAADPADVRVVEKQIPKPVMLGHGLGAAVLAVCVLVVAL